MYQTLAYCELLVFYFIATFCPAFFIVTLNKVTTCMENTKFKKECVKKKLLSPKAYFLHSARKGNWHTFLLCIDYKII